MMRVAHLGVATLLALGTVHASETHHTERVFATANAYFLVYAEHCAPTFYDEVAFEGVPPAGVEIIVYGDVFRYQYGRDCQAFYDAEIMHRQMASRIYETSAFGEGPPGLSEREARLLGVSYWVRMTAEANSCGSLALDNRALAVIEAKARVGDLIAVGRGVIHQFRSMQAQGFSAFRTVAERCLIVRKAARALVATLVAEGLLRSGA